MAYSGCVGSSLITPREASAAMAMVALKTEKFAQPMAFSRELVPLNINKDMSLQEVVKATSQVRCSGWLLLLFRLLDHDMTSLC